MQCIYVEDGIFYFIYLEVCNLCECFVTAMFEYTGVDSIQIHPFIISVIAFLFLFKNIFVFFCGFEIERILREGVNNTFLTAKCQPKST